MSTIKNFQDIEAWQRARELSKQIYEITYSNELSKDYALKDQMQRSVGSIMDNIAEGFERDGRKEFIQFLSFAKGSAGELISQLCRAADLKYIDQTKYSELTNQSTEVARMIGAFMKYLKSSQLKGTKFQEPETRNSKSETIN